MVFLSLLTVRILNRLKILSLARIGYTKRILDSTWKIPIVENNEGFNDHQRVSEPYFLQVLQQLFRVKNFTFLDAGVNFGQTLLKIKSISADAPYIGFEPSGLCSYYTSQLIRVNKISQAKLIRCALSNEQGVLTLHAQAEGDTCATIMHDVIGAEEDKFTELVPVVTLDSLITIIEPAGKNILLKMDVEGAEWLVLQGATIFIETSKPVILFENLPHQEDKKRLARQQDIAEFLLKRQYQLFVLDEKNRKLVKLDKIDNNQNFSQTNYLAVPTDQVGMFAMPS